MFNGCSSVPSVAYWKKPMIATSDSNMPYSRRLCFSRCAAFEATPSGRRSLVAAGPGVKVSGVTLISARIHDGMHDRLLRGFCARELGHEGTFVHHVQTVAHAQQFGHLGRDHQDGAAFFGQ